MDIAEFLTRCLDEDEDEARDLLRGHPGPWRVDSPSEVRDSDGQVVVADEYHWTPMRYIARHDPARVLADIAAKRRHLELWALNQADLRNARKRMDDATNADELTRATIHYHGLHGAALALWDILRLDAAPHADRPGYDPEWAI